MRQRECGWGGDGSKVHGDGVGMENCIRDGAGMGLIFTTMSLTL